MGAIDLHSLHTLLFGAVLNDATIRGLVGYSASESRMYYQFPPRQNRLTAAKPAYLTYFLSIAKGMDFRSMNDLRQLPPVELVFDIYSSDVSIVWSIWDRLVLLYNGQQFSDANWEVKSLQFSSTLQQFVEEDEAHNNFYHGHTRFWADPIYCKSTLVSYA